MHFLLQLISLLMGLEIPSFYPASVLQPVMKEVQEAVTQAVVKEMQQLHRMIGVG